MTITTDIANELAAENERLKQLEQPNLLNAAQGILDAWEQSKDETHPRSAMAVMRVAVGTLYGAVIDAKRPANPDPESWLETLIQEIAYQRVKESYLFNVLDNAAIDRKADELATQIASLVETWILDEVGKAAEQAV
jgi:hypothetical protein